jgi:hypothetical protein
MGHLEGIKPKRRKVARVPDAGYKYSHQEKSIDMENANS